MKSEPLVSIIVPVYNVEKYICQCLDSILAQTYIRFELILVDDGSIDRSGEICDEYAHLDKRIKVIHQSNGGVSIARQTGIDVAIGEYSIHVDPDDWIDSDMLEALINKATEENAEMVICDYLIEDGTETHYCSQNTGDNPTAKTVLKKILLQQLHGSCCNKLVKRTCYNGIKFSPTNICILEDELFNLRVLSRNIKVKYLPRAFYHYRTSNKDSICHSISDKSIQSKIDVIVELEKILKMKPDNFYEIKKNVLFDAMRSKRFKLLKTLYPDISQQIIANGTPYRWYMPQSSCLALAMRGYPTIANLLYNFNIYLIELCKQLKKKMNRI